MKNKTTKEHNISLNKVMLTTNLNKNSILEKEKTGLFPKRNNNRLDIEPTWKSSDIFKYLKDISLLKQNYQTCSS